jgi:tryptophan-rich hypothetical protein
MTKDCRIKKMNKINPKKLALSKWTAVKPINKEKHFLINKVTFDEEGNVADCVIEAVMSQRELNIGWQDLKNPDKWVQGWK